MKSFALTCLTIFAVIILVFTSSVHAFDIIVPDTGQNLCYDWDKIMCDQWHMDGNNQVCDSPPYCPEVGEDFYGQDAQYTINPPNLTDNLDGTVTDNLTGLMWEQKTAANEQTPFILYTDAFQYCEDLTLGGYSDWRLPTRKEYATLFNMGRVSPSLDITYFPYYTSTQVYYWTSSGYYNNANQNWAAQIAFGMFETRDKTKRARARCARGTPEPSPSYTDYGNGTIVDNLSGLMWEQKTDDGGSGDKDNTYTWKDALAYCENLVLGNHSDWRLPNPKELDRLVDLGKSSPAINTTYFPNTNNGWYWTGTTCSGCHKLKAFAVDFTDGTLSAQTKFDGVDYYPTNYVRCVTTAAPPVIDSDNDGIQDSIDNCPTVCNPQQLDADGDGLGDLCDTTTGCGGCSQPQCEQACPPPVTTTTSIPDTDSDGILDNADNCPTVCNPQQLDADGDGLGDLCDTTTGCGGCSQPACETPCS